MTLARWLQDRLVRGRGWLLSRVGPAPSRREQLIDLAIAVPVGVFAVAGTRGASSMADASYRPVDALAFGLVVIAAAGLIVRRRWPLVTLVVTAGATTIYLGREYTYGPVVALMAFSMFNAAMRLPIRQSLPGCGALIGVLFAAGLAHVDADRLLVDGLTLIGQSAWLLVPWALGTVVQIRRESAARIRAESRGRYASEQRLEIARDVHDVVGHGLAVINMQAGIALHVLEKRPEQAAIALDAIKRTSKEALEELRATLAVYRSDDPAPRRPAPGLGQLESLVATTVESGLVVKLTVTGDVVELPSSVDLAGYRIVQESLTNILRHAGPATARVSVRYEPDAVLIDVTDNGRGPLPGRGAAGRSDQTTGGHGIVGMRERAEAVGGTVEAGPRAEGGFSVRARLPIGE